MDLPALLLDEHPDMLVGFEPVRQLLRGPLRLMWELW